MSREKTEVEKVVERAQKEMGNKGPLTMKYEEKIIEASVIDKLVAQAKKAIKESGEKMVKGFLGQSRWIVDLKVVVEGEVARVGSSPVALPLEQHFGDRLKPCPFCGGEAELLTSENGGYSIFHTCTPAYGNDEDDVRMKVESRLFGTAGGAIAYWNRRAE